MENDSISFGDRQGKKTGQLFLNQHLFSFSSCDIQAIPWTNLGRHRRGWASV